MARTDNWWPGRATRILGAGGPNWPERLKKPAGQRASAYVEGCAFQHVKRVTARGFPRFSATPISFANVRFWYTRTDELALPELGMLFIGRFWFTTKPQTKIYGSSQNWAFKNVRFWYTRNGHFWYYTRTN